MQYLKFQISNDVFYFIVFYLSYLIFFSPFDIGMKFDNIKIPRDVAVYYSVKNAR